MARIVVDLLWIKPGERVAIVTSRTGKQPTLFLTVRKVTKTHIITDPELPRQKRGLRFNRGTGEHIFRHRDCGMAQAIENGYYRIVGKAA